MIPELKAYFKQDEDAFYINRYGKRSFRGVGHYEDNVRINKAKEQAELSPVSFEEIFSYVNEFLELMRTNNGYKEKIIRHEYIELDGVQQEIINNGIIIKKIRKWEKPVFDETKKYYSSYDHKYDIIANKFQLRWPSDVVWLRFTTKGHLGVVAKSLDINYDYDTSAGKLVESVHQKWDESFVLIFPLTREILGNLRSGDIELGIGQYLIKNKRVPIIDYYSHNN